MGRSGKPLSTKTVMQILKCCKGLSMRKTAKKFGVAVSTVSKYWNDPKIKLR